MGEQDAMTNKPNAALDLWVGMLRAAAKDNPDRTEQLSALIGGINHNEIVPTFAAAALSTRVMMGHLAKQLGVDGAALIEMMQRANDKTGEIE